MVPDSDPPIWMAVKLRGVQGAVKRWKRAMTAFGGGCIINATSDVERYFTPVLQDNYTKLQQDVAIMHHGAE